jgi:nucleoside-diphosphate-sugar epimerase
MAMNGVDSVVHLAARTHVMRDTAADPLAEYRRINVTGTQALAEAAQAAGVRRFIFLSSIKVNGEGTTLRPYSETDAPCPEDAYGVSKREAELALSAAAADMETVVLRPPLLYGPGVKGNFLRLMRAIERGMPLPLGSIHNHRSLLYVGNLVDAIMLSLDHPAAAGKTYLVADDEGISTPGLVRAIAAAMHRPARLLPFPPPLLRFAGAITGKSAAVSRLLGSLQIDSSKIRRELGWQPRHTLKEGLRPTAEWYYRTLAADIRT